MHRSTPHNPAKEPLDLELPSEVILAQTEAMCERRPGFQTRESGRTPSGRRSKNSGFESADNAPIFGC